MERSSLADERNSLQSELESTHLLMKEREADMLRQLLEAQLQLLGAPTVTR